MKFSNNQILAFAFGLGATITVRIVGIFALSDLMALLFLPFIIGKRKMFADKKFRTLIVLLVLWMLSAIVSDLYNHTSQNDALKGLFSIVPLFACLIFSYWLLKKDYKLVVPFLWGISISIALSAGLGLDAFYQESVMRQGVKSVSQLGHYNKIIVWILTSFFTGAFAITWFKKYPRFVAIILMIFSFFTLMEGSRSLFLMIFISSVLLLYSLSVMSKYPWVGVIWKNKLKKRLPSIVVMIFLLSYSASFIYSYSVQNGYLGTVELQKYQEQKNTEIGLISGRSEFISSILAIKDSPILGHGSFAKDKNGYGYRAYKIAGRSEFILLSAEKSRGEYLIPTHSHLWQAWVYNGFLGGMFWIYILFFVVLTFIKKSLFLYPDFFAYLVYAVMSLIWTILFSPFAQKPYLAFTISLFLILLDNKERQIKTKPTL